MVTIEWDLDAETDTEAGTEALEVLGGANLNNSGKQEIASLSSESTLAITVLFVSYPHYAQNKLGT